MGPRTGKLLTASTVILLLALGPAGAFLDATTSLHFRNVWLIPTLAMANAVGCALGAILRPRRLFAWPLLATPLLWFELIEGFGAIRVPLTVYLGGLAGGWSVLQYREWMSRRQPSR